MGTHVAKYKLKDRTWRYRAIVKKAGHKPITQAGFLTKATAKRWGDQQYHSLTMTGLPLFRDDLKKQTVGQLFERYLKEIAPSKGSYVTIKATIDKALKYDLAKVSLAYVQRRDVYDYIALRQKEKWRGKPIKNSTIKRDINIFASAFSLANKRWGYNNLPNPFGDLDKDLLAGSNYRRKRRLKKGELEKLEEACDDCLGLNRFYVPLAIYLAIETGMRLQEIFNLVWSDIDFEDRRIEIRKSKTDYKKAYRGRNIVLTIRAAEYLLLLRFALKSKDEFAGDARIFPMSTDAFKQSWADLRKRAAKEIPSVKDLVFHDLRREAGSRFAEAGLTEPEHKIMMGHDSGDMTGLYVAELQSIQGKLDKYAGVSLGEFLGTGTTGPSLVLMRQTKALIKAGKYAEALKEYRTVQKWASTEPTKVGSADDQGHDNADDRLAEPKAENVIPFSKTNAS